MKKHLNYWLALALLLPALNACQDDNTMPGEEPGTAGTPTVVSASIGDEPDTRAQVTYGTKDPKEGEYFMWNTGDQFKAFNITTAEATPTAYTFDISNYNEAQPSNQADFSCANGFSATAGNKVAALYGNFDTPVAVTDANGKKGIRAKISDPRPGQFQTATPGNADLKHLQEGLSMYAMGVVDESGKISSLSFHHLLALFRITIRNQQSTDAKFTNVTIRFPENEKIICEDKEITIWEDNTIKYGEFYALNAIPFRLRDVNYKVNNQDYATIAPGSSYDCFFPILPATGKTASSITIGVEYGSNSQSLTIDGFTNVEIKAGMRYWFDLTVKADGTLAQTFKTDYAWYASNTGATEYTLSTPGELRALANLVNGTDEALNAAGVSGAVNFQGKTIRLAGNIDLGNKAWTPIGNHPNFFQGTFDGGGRHISGLNVDNGSDPYAGLFGYVSGGKVSNLRVSGKVTTTEQVAGGIAGTLYNGSTVENCIFSGEVSGASNVGGVAGINYSGTITGCYTKGSVTATNGVPGGIAGNNGGTITACYSEATVTGGGGGIAGLNGGSGNSISHCYATGSVSGIWNIGGIIGRHSEGTVENCIALNPALTRTARNATEFGRIAGKFDTQNYPYLTSCSAFEGMTIKDAGGTDIYADATGKHGDALTAAQCLTAATYTGLGFTAATAAANGWAFDTATPWTYLPWNKAFESFPGIQPDEYRISVPAHLNGGGVN